MTTDNFCFYLQNRLIQTSQTGGQRYSDTFPFSIPWFNTKTIEMILKRVMARVFNPFPATSDFLFYASNLSVSTQL
jgi:hypothetical protein